MVIAERRTYRPINARRKEPLTPEDMLRIEHQRLLLTAFEEATVNITSSMLDVRRANAIHERLPEELLQGNIPLDHLILPNTECLKQEDQQITKLRGELKRFWNMRISYIMSNSGGKITTLGHLRERAIQGFTDVPFANIRPESYNTILLALAEK